jgi:hypothetical protein
MRWIEIIHLRVNSNSDFESIKNQLKLIPKAVHSEIPQSVKIYRRSKIEGDLCILLDWKAENTACSPSDFGVNLTASLKEFGRVDHAVWIEI